MGLHLAAATSLVFLLTTFVAGDLRFKRVDMLYMDVNATTSRTSVSLESRSIDLAYLFDKTGNIDPIVDIGMFNLTIDFIKHHHIATFYNTTLVQFSKHTQRLKLKFEPYVTYLPEEDVLLFEKKMTEGRGWVTFYADIKWKWVVGGAARHAYLTCSVPFKSYSSRLHSADLKGEC